jgi:hypothetical protein
MDRRNFKIGIVSALLLLQGYVGSAKAEDMLIVGNQVNGIIVMTDTACKGQGVITKSTDAQGSILLWGCSLPLAGSIWKIRWNTGQEIYTDISQWSPTNAFTARYAKAKKVRE